MVIFCANDYDDHVFRGIVCSNDVATELDDEQFVKLWTADGESWEVRQHGFSNLGRDSDEAFAETGVKRALERAVQNSTAMELVDDRHSPSGQFMCAEPDFAEQCQNCEISVDLGLICQFQTFKYAIKEMQTFENAVANLGPPPSGTAPRLARLSEDIVKLSENLQVWPGLEVPISLGDDASVGYGVLKFIEHPDSGPTKVLLKWVGGPDRVELGDSIFCWAPQDIKPSKLGEVM